MRQKLLISVLVLQLLGLIFLGNGLNQSKSREEKLAHAVAVAKAFYQPHLIFFAKKESLEIGENLDLSIAPVWIPKYGPPPSTIVMVPPGLKLSANYNGQLHRYRINTDSLQDYLEVSEERYIELHGYIDDHLGIEHQISKKVPFVVENGSISLK